METPTHAVPPVALDRLVRHCCGSCIYHATENNSGWGCFSSLENPHKTDWCAVCGHRAEGVNMTVYRHKWGGFRIMTNSILNHPAFVNCEGELLVSLIGGSNLYGLNTPESDVDYRGVFAAKEKTYLAGFNKIESIVQTGEVDSTYYEIEKFLQLLRKSNTQVMEILFAPKSAIKFSSPLFERMVENRYKLINSDTLKQSLKGYVFSEIRLATGERSGQLGGKRKKAVETHGYSPKNFCQIFRLCEVGRRFFIDGEYMVKVQDFDPKYHEFLMQVKTKPEQFTCEELEKLVWEKFAELEKQIERSTIQYKFDLDFAANLVLESKYGQG